MGKLINSIRRFSFKGILVILFVFSLISVVLLVELSGIRANRYDRSLELMPDDKIITKEEALASLEKSTLLLRNSEDETSRIAYEQFEVILADMKVGHIAVDLAKDALPPFEDFSCVIVLLSDLTPLGQGVSELCDFADKLEKACIKTIEDGKMTKSLSMISTCENPVILNSLDFIKAIKETLDSLM